MALQLGTIFSGGLILILHGGECKTHVLEHVCLTDVF